MIFDQMFSEHYKGTYANKVKWFAGVADNIIHITLSDMKDENVFYDHMIHVRGVEQFEKELSKLCEHYIRRFIDVPQISPPKSEPDFPLIDLNQVDFNPTT